MAIIKPKLSPFVKWVGGKREVIKRHLYLYFPDQFNHYFEPFAGGGAVLFHLQPKNATINDINNELITTYKVIKDNPMDLILMLDEFKQNHSEEFYYQIRESNFTDQIKIAARFIYLNKTGYNGLYRVNKSNKFNVPFNKKSKDKLTLYSQENILNLSKYFKKNKIKFYNQDFQKILRLAKSGDFVFCDPPYDFEKDVKGFNSYNKNNFSENDQVNLANCLKQLDQKGVKWMHTNHNTKLIQNLYKDFIMIPIKTNRNINSKGDKRKNSGDEVVIMNYEKKVEEYLSSIELTNIEIKDLIDHKKIIEYVKKQEVKLNTLNYIIDNSEEKIINKIKFLFNEEDQNVFQVLPFLLAIKHEDISKNKKIFLKSDQETVDLKKLIQTEEGVLKVFKESGLLEFILQGKIKNFVDYLTGVEVGKDTNARKNRYGKKFENSVEKIINQHFGNDPNIKIDKQVKVKNTDLNKTLIKVKKLDFIITNLRNQKTVLIETSHYNGSGSKINETGKSYLELINEINEYQANHQFLWIADGNGMYDLNKETLLKHLENKSICTTKDLVNIIKEKLDLD